MKQPTKTSKAGTDNTLVVIPAHMTRGGLRGKALADIQGMPMVVRTWRRAAEARIGRVVIATADPDIARAAKSFGAQVVQVQGEPVDATSQAAAALQKMEDDGRYEYVLKLRYDYPTITHRALERCLEPLVEPVVDVATVAAPIVDDQTKADPSVVKAVLQLKIGSTIARVTDFIRLIPPDATGTQFRHIEVYAYRRSVLENFVLLPPSVRETQNKIEQLRVLDVGMRMDAALVDTAPLRVDTPADLDKIRQLVADESTR